MSHTLILCEKPTAAKAVAEALSEDKPQKMGEENSKAVWYEFDRDGEKFVVVPAVGHLFTLKQTDKGWSYPAFNVDWVPSFKANKFAAFSEPYFRNIENLAKDASDVIVASVDWNEPTPILNNLTGGVELEHAGKFIDECIDKKKDFTNYGVLGFDKNRKVRFLPIRNIIRHKIKEALYEIKTEYGRKVKITSSHSVFTLIDGEIKLKRGDELKKGDILLIPNKIPETPKNYKIDILKELLSASFKRAAYVKSESLIPLLKEKLIEKRKSNIKWVLDNQWKGSKRGFAHNYISIKKIKELNLDLGRIDENALIVPAKHRKNAIKRIVPFDFNLAKLIGFYTAEGSLNSEYCVRFHFGKTEKERKYAYLVAELFKQIFDYSPKVFVDKKECYQVKVDNSIIYFFFANILGFKNKISVTKTIPHFILNGDKKIRESFLDGYICGDGCVSKKSTTISTSSKDLANALLYLLLQDGIVGGISEHEDKKSIRQTRFTISLPKKFSRLKKSEDIGFVKVKDIKVVKPTTQYVYDFSVEGENFICGFGGVCCHNTDYDDEGEVIAFNILRFILGRKDAARMRFSTMTKEELIGSYEHAMKHLNKNLIEAGLARHYLDYYWGISLTRALTNSIKAANKRFRILSTGRVQGPTLHMLAKHEQKIKAFTPKPYWEIELDIAMGKQAMKAQYSKDKLWSKSEADKILAKAKGTAVVKGVKKKVVTQRPPKPYNTTSLLADIYRYFGYSPQQGMAIAEALYQAALISYPRTSSEKLPPDINYKKILSNLGKQPSYGKDAKMLLGKPLLKPEEGAKTDQAHPAIYPTGEYKRAGEKQQKVYDMIVRRFLACFGDPAKRESQRIELDVNGEMFFVHGTKTVEDGWTALYGRYAKREEILLPVIKAGDKFTIKDASQLAKKTQPPARFSQGSVLKEMEAKSLGTKSTRAQILQILYNRGYIIGKSIEVTELGTQLTNILEKNTPDVISEKLTKHFEELTDSIEAGKAGREDVMDEAKQRLGAICNAFRKKEMKIGEELTKAVIATQDKQSLLGTCPKCSGTLKVHKLWRTGKRFVGCSGYKKGCRFGAPLPREGVIISTEKYCEHCKTMIVQVHMPARRPFRMCLDINCETKKEWLDKSKLSKARAESIASKKAAEQFACSCGKPFRSKRALTLHKKACKGEANEVK